MTNEELIKIKELLSSGSNADAKLGFTLAEGLGYTEVELIGLLWDKFSEPICWDDGDIKKDRILMLPDKFRRLLLFNHPHGFWGTSINKGVSGSTIPCHDSPDEYKLEAFNLLAKQLQDGFCR